jgi:hypothetical protein
MMNSDVHGNVMMRLGNNGKKMNKKIVKLRIDKSHEQSELKCEKIEGKINKKRIYIII